jgi:hypothetical protein
VFTSLTREGASKENQGQSHHRETRKSGVRKCKPEGSVSRRRECPTVLNTAAELSGNSKSVIVIIPNMY